MENFELLLSNERLMNEYIHSLTDCMPNAVHIIVYKRNDYNIRYSHENGITVEPRNMKIREDDAEIMEQILNERLRKC